MKRPLCLSLLLVLFSIQAFSQWVEQATGFATPSRGIRYICAVDEDIVWATAYDGTSSTAPEIQEFTKTVDGGATWKAYTVPGYPAWGFAMIYAVDSSNAWIPTWNPAGGGAIIHTTDGGQTWATQPTAVFASPNGFPNIVHFWDVNNGMCMGDPNGGYFEIYTTTDGGTNWNRVPSVDIPNELSGEYGTIGLYSVVGNTIWFTTGKGRVYKSYDRGYHWTVSATPNTANQLQIDFQDAGYGIVQNNMAPNDAYTTTDGGNTWNLLSSTGQFYASDFCYVPGTTESYVSVGSDLTNNAAGISYSQDGGLNWTVFNNSDTMQFTAVDFPSNAVGYAGTFNIDAFTGGMWKYTGSDFVVDPCAGLVADFSQNLDTLDLYYSDSLVLTNASSGDYSTSLWDFGNLTGGSTTDAVVHYAATGTYQIMLVITGTTPCTETDTAYGTVVVVNTSSVDENLSEAGIQMYPNPARDRLNVITREANSEVMLMDAMGRIVFSGTFIEKSVKLDVSDLSQGMYYLRIRDSKGLVSGAVSVMR